MKNIKKLFGKKLKYLRTEKGFTQEQFAELIDMSSRALSAIECGQNFVTANSIEKICSALKTTPKNLFDFDYQTTNKKEIKKDLIQIINKNEKHLNTIYNIVQGYLK